MASSLLLLEKLDFVEDRLDAGEIVVIEPLFLAEFRGQVLGGLVAVIEVAAVPESNLPSDLVLHLTN